MMIPMKPLHLLLPLTLISLCRLATAAPNPFVEFYNDLRTDAGDYEFRQEYEPADMRYLAIDDDWPLAFVEVFENSRGEHLLWQQHSMPLERPLITRSRDETFVTLFSEDTIETYVFDKEGAPDRVLSAVFSHSERPLNTEDAVLYHPVREEWAVLLSAHPNHEYSQYGQMMVWIRSDGSDDYTVVPGRGSQRFLSFSDAGVQVRNHEVGEGYTVLDCGDPVECETLWEGPDFIPVGTGFAGSERFIYALTAPDSPIDDDPDGGSMAPVPESSLMWGVLPEGEWTGDINWATVAEGPMELIPSAEIPHWIRTKLALHDQVSNMLSVMSATPTTGRANPPLVELDLLEGFTVYPGHPYTQAWAWHTLDAAGGYIAMSYLTPDRPPARWRYAIYSHEGKGRALEQTDEAYWTWILQHDVSSH